jgi:membrane associated rhomboid family serine protease
MENKISKGSFTASNIIIGLTILMYFIQTNMMYGSAYLGLNLNFTVNEFYWQPLSTIFAHGSLGHLLMNMFVLWQFGNLIERLIGARNFIFFYIFVGILTSLLSYAYIYFFDNNVNLVGASGAICALMGYIAYIDKTQRKGILIWVSLISVAPLLIGLPIAWYAHFIGLAIGFLFGGVMRLKNR